MATMRDGALNQYQAGNSDDTGGQIGRNVRRVLEQAQKIRVDPFLSTTERAEADKLSDPRIREALTHAGTYGLAEYLAAGPELLARYSEAWGGGNPVGAALVAAAVDCRRAGLTKAAPKELLEELRFTYLGKSGRDRLRREDLAVAWAWATNGSEAGIPLLLEVHHSAYVVFDYLVDHAQGNRTAESNVPREVLGRILVDADAGEAQMIGWTARSQGYDDVTCRAFAQSYKALIASLGADHPQTLYAQASVAYAKYCLGHWKEAMSALQAVIARSTRVLGSRDPLTLSSRIDLTYLLTDTRRLHEAEAEFKSILKVLSADDDQYITAQNGLAITYLESGQPELAERQFQKVITAMAGRYGPDNRGTLTPRCYRALAIERQGRLDEAEYEQRTVLRELEAAYGGEYMVTLQSRSNLAEVLRKQGRLIESEQEYTSVLEVRTIVFGEDHPATLGGAACLAAVIAEQGRLAEAKAVYGALISGYCRTFGRQHQETIKVRQELAATLRKMGKLSEANKQYVRILKAQEGTLGPDHEDALATRQIIDSLAN
jgi:tetratricopeptide (TPR) repeat protein